MASATIKLGQKVRDTVTGFEGIATSKAEYLNGCIQYGVAPKATEPGKLNESVYFDWQRLEIIDEGILTSVKRALTGGPQREAPPSNYGG